MTRLGSLFLIMIGLYLNGLAQESQYQGWVYFEEGDPSPYVEQISDQVSLERFRRRIPKRQPSKKRPAPANEDPLRTAKVDFQSQTLIIVSRNETISAYPEFKSMMEMQTETVLRFCLPVPPPEARPYGWGTYRAILVPSGKNYRIEVVE